MLANFSPAVLNKLKGCQITGNQGGYFKLSRSQFLIIQKVQIFHPIIEAYELFISIGNLQ